MLLQTLIDNLNLDITLSLSVGEIEISDDFLNNPAVISEDNQVKIYCTNEDNVTRVICFDSTKKLILDLFKGGYYVGGTVYDFDGRFVQII